jgi:LuxR family maltose regulon positive regulatory protein
MSERMKHDDVFRFGETLINCMNNICKTPITLMSAPVGYGKTTALREFFMRTNTNYRIISLGGDCAINTFWDSLRETLLHCADGAGNTAAARIPENFPMGTDAVSEALASISWLVFPQKAVVIFDDFHNMAFPDAFAFLCAIARLGIPNLHLVVSSRRDISGANDILLAGCANMITTKAFILSENDISKIFAAHGIEISPKQARALYKYTEGWPALIHNILVSVTLAGNLDRPSISAFESDIILLLTEAVYHPLPDDCKELLLRLCGEEHFTEGQAAFVYEPEAGWRSVRGVLDKISRFSAFVLKDSANGAAEYKVHNFFAKAIRLRFGLLPERERANFQKKMGDWFFFKGRYRQAANYYRLAEDAASFFEAYEHIKLFRGSRDIFLMLISFFTREAKNLPSYNLSGVLTFAAEMYLQGASNVFRDIADSIPASVLSGARHRAETEMLLCAADECDLAKITARIRRASRLAKDKLRDKLDFVYANPSLLFLYHKIPGALENTVDAFSKLMDDYRALTGAGDNGATALLKSEIHYCQGNFERAGAMLRIALLNSLNQQEFGVWMAGRFLMARLRLVSGDIEGAFETIGETRERILSENEEFIKHTIDLCENFLRLMLGDSGNFTPWILSGGGDRLIGPLAPFADTLRGACLLKNGRAAEITAGGLPGGRTRSSFQSALRSIYDNLTLSMALAEGGAIGDSLEILRAAMDMAIPDNLCAPFFEICPVNWTMFDRISAGDPAYRPFIGAVRKAGRRLGGARAAAKSDMEIFTKRERELVSLLRSGMKNKEIADALYISENTVKSILKIIFRKTGVVSRKELKTPSNKTIRKLKG